LVCKLESQLFLSHGAENHPAGGGGVDESTVAKALADKEWDNPALPFKAS